MTPETKELEAKIDEILLRRIFPTFSSSTYIPEVQQVIKDLLPVIEAYAKAQAEKVESESRIE